MPLEVDRWRWRTLIASDKGPPDSSTRLVLFVLSLHMNPKGTNAFPSQELIASRSGLSLRSVRHHLNLAESGEWVKRFERRRPGKSWFSHEYTATIPDRLEELCDLKPWLEDPNWRKATAPTPQNLQVADSAARYRCPQPANGARHPAGGAQEPANNNATAGNQRLNTRQPLPTNPESNYGLNSSSNTPSERVHTQSITLKKDLETTERKPRAEATLETEPIAKLEEIQKAGAAKAARVQEQKAAAGERVRKLLRTEEFSIEPDQAIAKIARADIEQVREIRSEIST